MPREVGGFVLVDDEHRDIGDLLRSKGQEWRYRKDDAGARRRCGPSHLQILGEGHFHLEKERVALAKRAGGDLAGIRRGVGTGRQHDRVLATFVDGDDGDAGGAAPAVDVGEIDAGRQEFAERDLADVVVADRADEAHLGPGAPRGERLVGALAAGDQRIIGTPHSLARVRRARHPADEVDIDRAEDGDHGSAVSAR